MLAALEDWLIFVTVSAAFIWAAKSFGRRIANGEEAASRATGAYFILAPGVIAAFCGWDACGWAGATAGAFIVPAFCLWACWAGFKHARTQRLRTN